MNTFIRFVCVALFALALTGCGDTGARLAELEKWKAEQQAAEQRTVESFLDRLVAEGQIVRLKPNLDYVSLVEEEVPVLGNVSVDDSRASDPHQTFLALQFLREEVAKLVLKHSYRKDYRTAIALDDYVTGALGNEGSLRDRLDKANLNNTSTSGGHYYHLTITDKKGQKTGLELGRWPQPMIAFIVAKAVETSTSWRKARQMAFVEEEKK